MIGPLSLQPYDGTPDVRGWFYEPITEQFLHVGHAYDSLGQGDYTDWYLAVLGDGTPAVILSVYQTNPGQTINPLVVAPDHRGRGVGRATLAALIEHPDFKGELWARVGRDNHAGLACFESRGFAEVPDGHDPENLCLRRAP